MKSQIKSILIPTDFSESSERALTVGIAIAKRHKAKVLLLHVIENYSLLQPVELVFPGINLPPDIKVTMEKKIKNLSEVISKKSGVRVTCKVLTGSPSEQICILAFREKISMIVIGSHGISGIRRIFMGSDAYRVVKNAQCPVLTVPGKWTLKEFKKVLFPIRAIPGALYKYFYSRPIIEKNNSELFLLGLINTKTPENTEELTVLIGKMIPHLYNDNIKFQTIYYTGDDFPAEIAKTAKDYDTDLIILTANLDNDWKSFFIGPFVQQVISHAQVPVLSIKPPDDKTEQVQPYTLVENWGRYLDLSVSI